MSNETIENNLETENLDVDNSNENQDVENNQENVQNNENDNLNNEQENKSEFIGAPENYDFKNLNLPEGIQFDNALAEKFATVGKKLNLSQDAANELVNMLVEHQKGQLGNQEQLIAEFKRQELETTKIEYQKLLNSDNEIGSNKEAKEAYLDVADKGYSAFASKELQDVLAGLGLDYHPSVIKHFHKLGELCGNDSIQKPSMPVGSKQSAAEILYGERQ